MIGYHKTKSVRSLIDKLNLQKITMAEQEQKYARKIFMADIEATERLLNIDLSAWKK